MRVRGAQSPRGGRGRAVRGGAVRAAAALAGFLLLSGTTVEARVIERIVAVVNSSILLQSDLDERVRPYMAQLDQVTDASLRKERLEQLRRQALEHMIDEEIIKQEAQKLKIEVSDAEVEMAVKDVMRKNNLTREQLAEALQQEGKSLAAYKDQILRPQLLRLRVLNIQVRSRVSVGDDEVKAYYQKNLRALGVETKVRARHIFLVLPAAATVAQVAERKRQAEALLAKAREGADFAELAKKHSQDSATRADGGDLGWFGRGQLPADVENVVFAMKKGEIRGPLRTERGFHVIQLLERQESSARSFAEVEEDLREQIYAEKIEKATKAWLAEARKHAHVDIKL